MRCCYRQGTEHKTKGNAYRICAEKVQGKRPLGRSRHRWEDSIKMDLKETGVWRYRLNSSGPGKGRVVSF
jgi:hypothetical protein